VSLANDVLSSSRNCSSVTRAAPHRPRRIRMASALRAQAIERGHKLAVRQVAGGAEQDDCAGVGTGCGQALAQGFDSGRADESLILRTPLGYPQPCSSGSVDVPGSVRAASPADQGAPQPPPCRARRRAARRPASWSLQSIRPAGGRQKRPIPPEKDNNGDFGE